MGNTLLKVGAAGAVGGGIVRYTTEFLDVFSGFGVDEKEQQAIIEYIKPLVFVHFHGETSGAEEFDTISSGNEGMEHLGKYLKQLDQELRKYKPEEFNADNCEEFKRILRLCCKYRKSEQETEEDCYERFMRDARKFKKVYKQRAEKHPELAISEKLETEKYWGTRQQLLAGKVICDWICEEAMPPMDPIFGVLLNPTAGRVGPGDSFVIHEVTFEIGSGNFAYHAVVHDAFGYLVNNHSVGPGYNYMGKSYIATLSPYSGQFSGLSFWRSYLNKLGSRIEDPSNFKTI